MAEGSSNHNAGDNLVLISGSGSTNIGALSLLGGSIGSGFGGSTTIESSSSADNSSSSKTIKTENEGLGAGTLS